MEHEGGKSQPVITGQRASQPLVVTSQPAKPCRPGKRAFDHPAPRQKHKATLGFVMFDHFQFDSLRGCIRRRLPAGVTLMLLCSRFVDANSNVTGSFRDISS